MHKVCKNREDIQKLWCSRQDVTLSIHIAQQGSEKLCMHEETICKTHKKACILLSMLASS